MNLKYHLIFWFTDSTIRKHLFIFLFILYFSSKYLTYLKASPPCSSSSNMFVNGSSKSCCLHLITYFISYVYLNFLPGC